MSIGYVVTESLYIGGESVERTVGVCPTLPLAEMLSKKVENSWDLEDNEITREIFYRIWKELNYPDCDILINLMIERYPEYSVTDVEKAVDYYMGDYPFVQTNITEVRLFNSKQDILNHGIEH